VAIFSAAVATWLQVSVFFFVFLYFFRLLTGAGHIPKTSSHFKHGPDKNLIKCAGNRGGRIEQKEREREREREKAQAISGNYFLIIFLLVF